MAATQKGVPLDFVKVENIRMPLQPVDATASSSVSPIYDAAKGFDGNKGTLWAAPKEAMPVWLQADFGKTITVEEVQPVFDLVMGDYTYRIEYFTNGTQWEL